MEGRLVTTVFAILVLASFTSAAPQNDSHNPPPKMPSIILPSFPIPSTIPTIIKPTEPAQPTTTTTVTTTTIPTAGTQETRESYISSTVTTRGLTSTIPVKPPGKQSTTTTTVCGGDTEVCYVDFTITGGEKPECCTPENNPTCALCFNPCRITCDGTGEGVAYCFGTDISFGCKCTEGRNATCYPATTTTTLTTTTLYPGLVNSAMEDKPVFYLIFLILMIVLLAFVVYYVRSL
jgi:hypothetical protein